MNLPYLEPAERYGKLLAGYAKFFRSLALEIDENPDVIFDHVEHPGVRRIILDKGSTASERTHYLEAYAYGDPGVLMSMPGPSLSGLMIRELGTKKQVDDFYDYLNEHNARTFFALTEPDKGSDAGKLESELKPDPNSPGDYLLNGEKCLFGNGAKGQLGVILARTSQGPLGIRAVYISPEMLDSSKGWITRETLDHTGLRGAQIAYMRFNNCPVKRENLLGAHLGPMERGMMAVIKTFNRLRTGVGALALGQAQAVLDYVYHNKKEFSAAEKKQYAELYYQLDCARTLLHGAAEKIDQAAFDSFDISLSKVQATSTVEKVIPDAIALLGPGEMLKNQWLAKCYRDSFAWEYMEGTTNMQLKNVFNELQVRQNNLLVKLSPIRVA